MGSSGDFNSARRSSDAAQMDGIGLFVLGISAVSSLTYSIAAHSLSVIARKTGHSSTMEILAWVPVLQVIPALAVGGSSPLRCLTGTVALMVTNVTLFLTSRFLGEGLGSMLFGFGVVFSILLCFIYLARTSWNTATARNLPGWFGLLVIVPVVSFFVYPIMAFHDGWARPHKIGLAIALLIATVSIATPSMMMRRLESNGDVVVELPDWTAVTTATRLFEDLGKRDETPPEIVLVEESTRDAAPGARPTNFAENREQSIRVLLDLKGSFDSLDALTTPENMRDQTQRARALGLVLAIHTRLRDHRADLDAETYTDLASHLVRIEAQIQGSATTPSGASGMIRIADSDAIPTSDAAAWAAAPAPLAAFAGGDVAPIRPFPVNASGSCPSGAELRSRTGEKGEEEWCQQLAELGGLRDGWYARYFDGGHPEQVGEYRDGLRVGVWTRFYRTGEVRAQAEFEKGLQHGWLLSFDNQGEREKAVRFDQGIAVR